MIKTEAYSECTGRDAQLEKLFNDLPAILASKESREVSIIVRGLGEDLDLAEYLKIHSKRHGLALSLKNRNNIQQKLKKAAVKLLPTVLASIMSSGITYYYWVCFYLWNENVRKFLIFAGLLHIFRESLAVVLKPKIMPFQSFRYSY